MLKFEKKRTNDERLNKMETYHTIFFFEHNESKIHLNLKEENFANYLYFETSKYKNKNVNSIQ